MIMHVDWINKIKIRTASHPTQDNDEKTIFTCEQEQQNKSDKKNNNKW